MRISGGADRDSTDDRPRLGFALLACAGLLVAGWAGFGDLAARASEADSGRSPRKATAARAVIPPQFLDLLTKKKAFANLATIMPKGNPQVTPVWFDFDGHHIRINSVRGRVKDRNMRRDPRVSLCILDPDNPYRYLMIGGRVVKVTEEGADEHINALARKYLGVKTFHGGHPGDVRVLYVIEPRRVAGHG